MDRTYYRRYGSLGACAGSSIGLGASILTNQVPVDLAATTGAGCLVGLTAGCYGAYYLYNRLLETEGYVEDAEVHPEPVIPINPDPHHNRTLLRFARGLHSRTIQHHAGGGLPGRVHPAPLRLPPNFLERIEARIPADIIREENELVRQAASGSEK